MARTGIKDRVAIIGAGYTKFGERFDAGVEDLLTEACGDAFADAGVQKTDIQAGWVGIQYWFNGLSGAALADAIKLYGIPMTHVENYCASGMDAFRNACYSVASGVNDLVLACGVEKLSDQASRGLPGFTEMGHPVLPLPSAPAMFATAATRCFHEYGWTKEDLGRVAVKNHENGAVHPKAHFRKAVSLEEVIRAPMIADPLGRYDCCAMSDGAAALVLTSPEMAPSYAKNGDFVVVKANAIATYSNNPWYVPSFPFTGFWSTQKAAELAYHEAGVEDPAKEISLAEVHDCFTITELVNCEDLRFCARGTAAAEIANGTFNWDGAIPINPSGGLKCFGHPIGATGCRMLVELTKQLRGKADGRQVKDPRLGLAHNLGGAFTVASVTILGTAD
jgi:acetyl-CoA C-acetyltransferase